MPTKTEYFEKQASKRLALNVKAIRKSRKMTQAELAEKAGYKSAQAIVGIENGTRPPAYEKVKDIANALGVSIAQLKGLGKIEQTEKGYPRLTEPELMALYTFAPILATLSDEQVDALLEIAIAFSLTNEKEVAWAKYEKEKQ